MSLESSLVGNDPKQLSEELYKVLESHSANSSEDGTVLAHLRDLLTGTAKLVGSRANEHKKKDIVDLDDDMAGVIFMDLPDAQFLEPRGRFRTKVSSTGLMLEGKSASFFVSWAHVTHTAVIPAHQSTKKEGEDMLAIRLEPDVVTYNGKPLKNLLWNMQKIPGKPLKVNIGVGSDIFETIEGTESHVVTSVVAKALDKPLTRPRPDLFSTVATKDSKPYLRCHKGIQEGAIYPLECGVVFIKPTLFLPTEEIASINAGRGGGSGQTRFVDLIIETSDDKSHEFTNIDREELPALQGYVKGYLEARAAAAAAANGAIDEDSDEDDDDYDGEDSSEESGGSDDDSDDDDDDYADEGEGEEDEETEDEEEEIGGDENKKKKGAKEHKAEKQPSVAVKQEGETPKKKESKKESKDNIRKKVSPKKRGSSSSSVPVKKEEGIVNLTESAPAPHSAAAAIKAAYQKSFQVKRELEGEENVTGDNKVQKIKAEEGVKAVKSEPQTVAAVTVTSAPPSVFVLE